MNRTELKEQLQKFAQSPLLFRQSLKLKTGRGEKIFGDCMADFQKRDFAALDPSLTSLAAGTEPPIKRFWFEKTKGCSKTSDLASSIIWLLAFSPRPLMIRVGARDADQADELRKAARDLLRLNPWIEKYLSVSVQQRRIVGKNDSEAVILTADKFGSHGGRIDLTILDELVHHASDEFAATLADDADKIPNGVLIVATNAGHSGTWQQRWRDLAISSDRWHFSQHTDPAPWIDQATLDEAKRRNPASRYDRLWRGLWVGNTASAIGADDLEAACSFPTRHPPVDLCAAGLDLGHTRDAAALVVVHEHDSIIYVHRIEIWTPEPGKPVSFEGVEQRIRAIHDKTPIGYLLGDPWNFAQMQERLLNAGINCAKCDFVAKSLQQMATVTRDAFQDRVIAVPSSPNSETLIADLSQLKLVEKNYGFRLESPRSDAHEGTRHGDSATALFLALLAHQQMPFVTGLTIQGPLVCYP